MKLLHINDDYGYLGGVTEYIVKLMSLLDAKGHQNLIAFRKQSNRQISDGRKQYNITSFRNLEQLLQTEKPDLVMLHLVYEPDWIDVACQYAPTFAYMHGFYPVCPGLAKYFRRTDVLCQQAFGWRCVVRIYLDRCSSAKRPDSVARIMQQTRRYQQAYSSARKFLVANQYMKQLYVQNGFSKEKMIILPPHFVYDRPVAFSPKQSGQLLYVGRLEIEKGIPYLLQMFHKLPQTFRLTIVGDGSMRAHYQAMTAEMGMGQRVRFSGWLSGKALEDEYQKSAILIMPSLTESFGKVGIEAMHWGTPVIAFSVGGIPEWLQDGRTGYLIPALDVNSMAEQVKGLMHDEALRYAMGQNAITYVNEQFRAEDHIKTLLHAFED